MDHTVESNIDCWIQILSWANTTELLNLGTCCKALYELTSRDIYWSKLWFNSSIFSYIYIQYNVIILLS